MPRYLCRICLLVSLSAIAYCDSTFSQTTYDMALGYRRAFNSDWLGFNGANTIHDSIGWPNPYLIGKLPLLNPKNLRYPGGSIANWWNWRIGGFVNNPNLPPGDDFQPLANKLEDFKKALDTTHAHAIFDVNMLSSSLKEQIAMLKHADSIGIPVSLVELGNEFYLDGEDDSVYVVFKYPTAQVYADSASLWADSIHHYFPNAKVAAQGAFNRNNAPRRITWDENMFPTLHGEDVISYHTYMSADNYDESSIISSTFSATDLPALLGRPFKMWNILTTKDFPLIPPGKDIWITEYNLRDHSKPVHGCWGHGLFLATQTMLFLNDGRIKHLACHAMCGTAVAGAYYNTVTGYNFGGAGNFFPPPNPPSSTQYWGLTSGGRALQQLGLAVKDAIYASPIEFKYIPSITAFDGVDTLIYPAVYGWAFVGINSTEVLIVNLSANDVKVKTTYVFPAGGTYERYYADPMLFEAYESDISHKSITALPTSLLIKAYSITRLIGSTVPTAPPVVSMVANGPESFCEGDSVKLDAGPNYVEYRWSTGDSSRTIWAKMNGDYWVHVRSIINGYWAGDTIHITVHQRPDIPRINNLPSLAFCHGDSLIAIVKLPDETLSYSWSNGAAGTSATIKAGGSYTLYATNSSGCSSASVPIVFTEYALPQPVLSASGPTSFCYDQSVTLDAGPGYKSYTWSDGSWGQTAQFTASGSYTCTVKDNNNCYGTSNAISLTVHTPADPTITITGPTVFCKDGSTPCTLKTITGYTYQWQQGGNTISGATKKTYIPAAGGTYKVIITDSWGCSKASPGTLITVNPLPSTGITVTGGKNYCTGKIITLNAKIVAGCTYQWQKNGANISGSTLSTYLVTSSGNYTYAATNLNGCKKTSKTIIITSNNCREAGSVAAAQNEISMLNVYPNPACGEINIDLSFTVSLNKNFKVEIRNVLGDLMYEKNYVQENETWNGELKLDDYYVNGVYFVIIKTPDAVFRKEFVVQKN